MRVRYSGSMTTSAGAVPVVTTAVCAKTPVVDAITNMEAMIAFFIVSSRSKHKPRHERRPVGGVPEELHIFPDFTPRALKTRPCYGIRYGAVQTLISTARRMRSEWLRAPIFFFSSEVTFATVL